MSWRSHIDGNDGKARQKTRYVSALFRGRAERARMTLFRSLIISVNDYCNVVVNPPLKCVADQLESSQMAFLRTLRLGVTSCETSGQSYTQRLDVLRWDPVFVRRIRSLLKTTYKLVYGLIPYGEKVFKPLVATGITRTATQLRNHPRSSKFQGQLMELPLHRLIKATHTK